MNRLSVQLLRRNRIAGLRPAFLWSNSAADAEDNDKQYKNGSDQEHKKKSIYTAGGRILLSCRAASSFSGPGGKWAAL